MRSLLRVWIAAALVSVSSAFTGAPRALGQDAPPDDESAPAAPAGDAQAAWKALLAVRAETLAAQKAKDTAKVRDLRSKEVAAQRAFVASFAASDWDAYDPARDQEMLEPGLLLAGADALSLGDGAAARRAFEAYLAKFPKGESAALVEGVHLPNACIVAGDVDRAVPLLEKHAESLFSQVRAGALVCLGDVRAAREGVESARATWAKVEGLPTPSSGREVYFRATADAALRLALVGAEAPEIDSVDWVGGTAKPLSALRGSVVVLDFFATWGATCRRTARRMSALGDAKREAGLAVLGVTRFFDYGFLPRQGAEDPVTQGDRVGSMGEEDFQEHLRRYRANLGISLPLVTATREAFKAYRVQDIPMTVAIDRAGVVAFVKAGPSDTLLRAAVDRLLATPAAPGTAPK